MKEASHKLRRRMTLLLAVSVICAILWAGYGLVSSMSTIPPPFEQKFQQITLVMPPPPPPPEVEPEPEQQVEEEVELPPEPESLPDESESEEAPAGEELGLDAEGVAGDDGFGLVSRKGGRDLLGGGSGSFTAFSASLEQDITRLLTENEDIRKARYNVIFRIWIDKEGRVERSELVGSTGDSELDQALELALSGQPRISRQPPQDMPQPVKLRIVSRL